MKVAVLCNGPSRVVYKGRADYEYVIGCNIPWSEDVEATVILDENVIEKWWKTKELIKVPVYISRMAWRGCINRQRQFFTPFIVKMIETEQEYDSSGHNAVKVVLEMGATQIDIYGCDSMFQETTMSYTNNFVHKAEFKNVSKQVNGWRNRWERLIAKHPEVRFNFIGENDEIISY